MNDSANQSAKPSWWQRLTSGLKRTSASIGGAIADIVSKRKLDAGTIEELEEVLIRADLGVATAARIAAAVADGRYDKSVTTDEGKTTTIGKLAARLRAEGRNVMLAAGDTFRAAAIEQLKVWGQRTGSPVIAGAQGSDSASLAFNALSAAREGKLDVLLVDTAGRLQNKAELMKELEKVVRVIRKVDASAPHAVLLVLDATVGQNALSQ